MRVKLKKYCEPSDDTVNAVHAQDAARAYINSGGLRLIKRPRIEVYV